MNAKIQRQLRAAKRRIERRLDKSKLGDCSRPVFASRNIHYELAERAHGMTYGGVGAIALLVRQLGLAEAIDRRLHLLKIHLPYHESDHVLNLAYNALCDGTCLEDIELRRNDEVYLDALGARRIPDPTTAGDFCRRFRPYHVGLLQDVFDDARRKVWAEQPEGFFAQATIDMDGTLVATSGECKEGMDIAYDGTWGFHPLVVSLAETGEVLRIVNRSGNRPSHEGAAAEADRAIRLCLSAGFQRILLRGDTDFTQTRHLDRWSDDPRVRFIFGVDCLGNLLTLADDLPESAWKPLKRPPPYHRKTARRARPKNVKEQIVEARGYKNIRLVDEWVAEFDYRPTACRKTYRLVVIRKELDVYEQGRLFEDYRYFFYLTNDREWTQEEVVFSANDRCDQENLMAQLKGGVRALYAPVDNLTSNWAWMVMTALAWNLKAWLALSLPEHNTGRVGEHDRATKRAVLRMEFKTFINAFIRLPCQIVTTGRRVVYRLLAWNRWLETFFRLVDQLRRPLRC